MYHHNNADFAAGIVMQENTDWGFFREWTQAASLEAFPIASMWLMCYMLIDQRSNSGKSILKSSTPYCAALIVMSIKLIMALSFTKTLKTP